jgi:hypothetical protein
VVVLHTQYNTTQYNPMAKCVSDTTHVTCQVGTSDFTPG